MDNLSVGQRIKYYREQAEMSQADLCGLEEELTIRQLRRIEKGDSSPKLETLEFIAKQLGVFLSDLTDGKKKLPERYEFLKHELLKLSLYDDSSRLETEERFFKEIFDDYFEMLPIEERKFITFFYSIAQTHIFQNLSIDSSDLRKRFQKIKEKDFFTASDLLTIDLWIRNAFYDSIDGSSLELVKEKLIAQSKTVIGLEAELLIKLWIVWLGFYEFQGNYFKMRKLLPFLYELMKRTNNLVKKPIVDMLEGKCLLFVEKDLVNAERNYQQASQLALLQGDELLSQKILEEWEQDKIKFI